VSVKPSIAQLAYLPIVGVEEERITMVLYKRLPQWLSAFDVSIE